MTNKQKFWRYLEETGQTYAQYLQSEHWRDLKNRYRASRLFHGCCSACGATDRPLELHHKTYKRIGHEWLMDVCMLCRQCHQAAHVIDRTRTHGILWGAAKRVMKNLAQTGNRLRGFRSGENRKNYRGRRD